jgi:hypothetical protein
LKSGSTDIINGKLGNQVGLSSVFCSAFGGVRVSEQICKSATGPRNAFIEAILPTIEMHDNIRGVSADDDSGPPTRVAIVGVDEVTNDDVIDEGGFDRLRTA